MRPFLAILALFLGIIHINEGEILDLDYMPVDKGTWTHFSTLWEAAHSKWDNEGIRIETSTVSCPLGHAILPVCLDGAVLGSEQPLSRQKCPEFICHSPSACPETPPDVHDYIAPPSATTSDKHSICTPPVVAATVYVNETFESGIPPAFVQQSPVGLNITGTVKANINGKCVPLANARIEMWQVDIVKLTGIRPTSTPVNLRQSSCRGLYETGEDGAYAFETTVPPSYGPPRHINVAVTADGYDTLTTRMYFTLDGRLRQLTTAYSGDFKATSGVDDDATFVHDHHEDSSYGTGYPGVLAQDPRVVQNFRFVSLGTGGGAGERGYYEGTFDITLRPLRSPIASKDSAIIPMDLEGMWTNSMDGGMIKVETFGHTFIAAEYPHTRTWGTVMGALSGDTISGVDFRVGKVSSLKDGAVSRAQTALENADEALRAAEWDAASPLRGAHLLGPAGAADKVYPGGLSVGVAVSQDMFTTASSSGTISWSGGGASMKWFRQPTMHAGGYRYFKLTVMKETTDVIDEEQGRNSGGVLRINEIELYEGFAQQIKVPRVGMTSTFTPMPLRVSCSSFQHQDHHCFRAFDNSIDPDSMWLTKPVGVNQHVLAQPQWVLLDLGAERGAVVTGLRIVCDTGHPEKPLGCPMTFKLEASYDNIRFVQIFSKDMFDYDGAYGQVMAGTAANDVRDSLGMRFDFFWEAASGRASGHRCGSCDAAPLHMCAYSAVDATCATGYCSNEGKCSDIPNCPVGEYRRAPLEMPGRSGRANKFDCIPCPAGRYGNVEGLTSAACSGMCAAGYWCGEGSTSPTQNACVDGGSDGRAAFCPAGSGRPVAAAAGRRTVSHDHDYETFPSAENRRMVSDVLCAPGHFCIDGVQHPCPPGRFGNKQGMDTSLCEKACLPGEYCPEMSVQPTTCPPGYFCPDGITRMPCPPGRFGADSGLRSAACSGFCEPGHYCDAASISPTQNKCPSGRYGAGLGLRDDQCSGECLAGYYCPDTIDPDDVFSRPLVNVNSTSQECGFPDRYCPRHSSQPVLVSLGHYTVGGVASRRVSQRPCERGFYCVRGERFSCPPGTYGDREKLSYEFQPHEATHTFICSGFCEPGHYCLANSTSAVQNKCPAGRYGKLNMLNEGLVDAECYAVCPVGHYCPAGSPLPIACPGGTFGNVTGLTSPECRPECEGPICDRNLCREGFYCPEGSFTDTERPCGGKHVYCPTGSAAPRVVDVGFYSTGPLPIENDDGLTRSAQKECPRGSFCSKGVKRFCPPGTYGLTRGLSTEACTALCPPGHFCPEGSFNGTFQRCPAGRYGATSGLHDSSCSGPCAPGFYCPEGSTRAEEVACGLRVESRRYWRPSPEAEGVDVGADDNDAVFCPEGSAAPLVALPGHFTRGGNRTTRFDQLLCPPGSYCVDGRIFDCPAGTYGRSSGLQSKECTGLCQKGHFCPVGSTSMTEHLCPAGRFGRDEGLGSELCSGACSQPRECPMGSVFDRKVSPDL